MIVFNEIGGFEKEKSGGYTGKKGYKKGLKSLACRRQAFLEQPPDGKHDPKGKAAECHAVGPVQRREAGVFQSHHFSVSQGIGYGGDKDGEKCKKCQAEISSGQPVELQEKDAQQNQCRSQQVHKGNSLAEEGRQKKSHDNRHLPGGGNQP